MATYNVGFLLRQIRQERGITQERLCAGLCSVSTLSRIERGTYTPANYLFRALMERLGHFSGKYYSAFLGEEDFDMWRNREAISHAIMHKDLPLAEGLIEKLQDTKYFIKGPGLQIMLNCRACLEIAKLEAGQDESFDAEECLRMVHKSIRITIPDFDERKIENYMLSYDEISAINCLAAIYYFQKNYEKAARVLYSLKESMDKFCLDNQEKAKNYQAILANLADTLYKLKKYDDSISMCILGRRFCIECNKAFEITVFLTIHGMCLAERGSRDEAKPMLRQAYHCCIGFGNQKSSETLASCFREYFPGEEIDNVYNVTRLENTGAPSRALRISCNGCGSENIRKSGFLNGMQRYKCGQCGRQFVPAGRRNKMGTAKLAASLLYVNGVSSRAIEGLLMVSKTTVQNWAKRYAPEGCGRFGDAEVIKLGEHIHIPKASGGYGKLVIILPVEELAENTGVVIDVSQEP